MSDLILLRDPKRLAKLLSSIKVGYIDRPLRPVEVAKELQDLLHDMNNDKNEVAKKLRLSLDMLNQFLRLLELPDEIQDMIMWGASKTNKSIGFSVANRLIYLKNKNDILKTVNAIMSMSNPITKNEIKGIIQWKKRNPDKPIEECILNELNIKRTDVIEHFIFISGIDPKLVKTIQKLSIDKKQTLHDFTKFLLVKTFPPLSLKNAHVFDDCIRISLTKIGHASINEYSSHHNILRKNVINHMLESVVD